MRKILLLLVIVTSTLYVNAQTNDNPTFSQIETLLKKAEGVQFWDRATNYEITKQTFGFKSVSSAKKKVLGGNIIKTVYTDIIWPEKIDYDFWGHPDDGIMSLVIRLSENIRTIEYTNDKSQYGYLTTDTIWLYFLPKDKDTLIKLLDKLLK